MKQNIKIKCPQCEGDAILYHDTRNKIRCFDCGFETYLLNQKLPRNKKIVGTKHQ